VWDKDNAFEPGTLLRQENGKFKATLGYLARSCSNLFKKPILLTTVFSYGRNIFNTRVKH
jgi:hypothetical protein